jgi:hypothetical protein
LAVHQRADPFARAAALLNWILGIDETILGNSQQICHGNQEWWQFRH